jgi:hypothetical protein
MERAGSGTSPPSPRASSTAWRYKERDPVALINGNVEQSQWGAVVAEQLLSA